MDVRQVIYAYERGCQNFIGDLKREKHSYWIDNTSVLKQWCERMIVVYDYLFYEGNADRIYGILGLIKFDYYESSIHQCVKHYDVLIHCHNYSSTALKEYLSDLTALEETSLLINSDFTEIMKRYMDYEQKTGC